jgi:hypothetical protein
MSALSEGRDARPRLKCAFKVVTVCGNLSGNTRQRVAFARVQIGQAYEDLSDYILRRIDRTKIDSTVRGARVTANRRIVWINNGFEIHRRQVQVNAVTPRLELAHG